jgi:hypothetical protein
VQSATDDAVTAVAALKLAEDVKDKISFRRGVPLKLKSGQQSVLFHVLPAVYLWFISLKTQCVQKKVRFSKPISRSTQMASH